MFPFFTKDKPAPGRVRVTVEVEPWVAEAIKTLAIRQSMTEPECGSYLLEKGIRETVPIHFANTILAQAIEVGAEEMILIPREDHIQMRYRVGSDWETLTCMQSDRQTILSIDYWPSISRRFENMGIGQLRRSRWPVSIKQEERVYDLHLQYQEEPTATTGKSLRFEILEKKRSR